MELHEEFNALENNAFLYINKNSFTDNFSKTEQFTSQLKKSLSPYDSEEIMIQKVVCTAIKIEFDNRLQKNEFSNITKLIAEAYNENEELKSELISVAKSVIGNRANHDISIN
ncbi:MAG: hypothetical protein DKM50_08945 [Candidatus Margulisiibacteriota bacterium]|nr:MAG: hypothetical protein A2X43_04525 [Candidatus Margulisbacteria bacterium GWD2_39_127]OGI04117.1 MAG: hypothetical protein A2X42_04640 [Candidatus Margulisbacteria bacterium GWF2_38_17]OGI05968.1 MAG: hypothetical protein A2X41_12150 [Candidatus Margulisbacteria bacterium GWE2_39_32]PZM79576.1 MAG: hypothetical protein DKM50_08945 [Candidatus Margulisiibacteriota bacterium]HAR63372.1 hypothetical protein [Candidatus Margulisiibacteriota bacterium]